MEAFIDAVSDYLSLKNITFSSVVASSETCLKIETCHKNLNKNGTPC